MFAVGSAFNIEPKVNIDKCVEYEINSKSCKRSNGTFEYGFTLRCLLWQTFPNGTVINESSLAKKLFVQRYVDDITQDMEPKFEPIVNNTNIGATVVTALIVIAVLVAIGLVCYAQKYKVTGNIFLVVSVSILIVHKT